MHRQKITGLVFGLSLFLLSGPLPATWSIALVNTETGEVGVGSATCLKNTNLKKVAGVVVVGRGAGQAQAMGDSTGENRTTMALGFLAGKTAAQILADLEATDPQLQAHQYGIVDIYGGSETFTGTYTSKFTGGLTGQVGPISYAIQGNVLAGEAVIYAAEAALIQTEGDLSTKLMASMHAAQHYGGDGRCSCKEYDPDSCGSPPIHNNKKRRDKYWKSAHVAYMVISRMGDIDGEFTKPTGFANGSYYMDLNVTVTSKPDPVDLLHVQFDDFRAAWARHADHLCSDKTIYPEKIPADGSSRSELLIYLVDLNESPITEGGASITVTHDAESAGSSTIGPVRDHGDGFYSVFLQSSLKAGTDIFRVAVDDGMGPVLLYPFPSLELEAPVPLAQ